jgi:hypothetical protein
MNDVTVRVPVANDHDEMRLCRDCSPTMFDSRTNVLPVSGMDELGSPPLTGATQRCCSPTEGSLKRHTCEPLGPTNLVFTNPSGSASCRGRSEPKWCYTRLVTHRWSLNSMTFPHRS